MRLRSRLNPNFRISDGFIRGRDLDFERDKNPEKPRDENLLTATAQAGEDGSSSPEGTSSLQDIEQCMHVMGRR
jgi:hypothetical protein